MTDLLLHHFVKDYQNTGDPAVRAQVGRLAGIVGILCNLFLFAGKLTAGLLAGAVSVSADAVNNLSDASSSIVTLLGFKLAQKPADEDHPYGHARIEYLSGLGVAALILLIGVELAKTSLGKILHPEPTEFTALTFGVLAVSILVKLWMSLFCRKLGDHIQSSALRATAADSRNDVVTTLAVVLGGIAGNFFDMNIDGFVGLAVAVFILISGCSVAKETVSPLLGGQADDELVENLTRMVLSHEKILGIHDLLVHDYGPGQCFASVHVEMSAREDPLACHDIIDHIERESLERLRVHLVIHYDPVVTDDPELNEMRAEVTEIVESINPQLSLHDFRLVRGAQHKTLVFDLAIPFSVKYRRSELKEQIDAGIKAKGKDYFTVITFDRKAH